MIHITYFAQTIAKVQASLRKGKDFPQCYGVTSTSRDEQQRCRSGQAESQFVHLGQGARQTRVKTISSTHGGDESALSQLNVKMRYIYGRVRLVRRSYGKRRPDG